MITLEDYGVILRQLSHDRIETVRQWRNHPKIQQYMEYREEITPEMQERWYQRISNKNNYFFILEYCGKCVGLINIRDIDKNRTYGESGIFIWDDDVLRSGVAVKAGLTMYDFAFNDLNLDYLVAHIYNTNPASIKYHAKFGFKLSKIKNNLNIPVNQLYKLTKEDYLKLTDEDKYRIAKITPPICYSNDL